MTAKYQTTQKDNSWLLRFYASNQIITMSPKHSRKTQTFTHFAIAAVAMVTGTLVGSSSVGAVGVVMARGFLALINVWRGKKFTEIKKNH